MHPRMTPLHEYDKLNMLLLQKSTGPKVPVFAPYISP